MKRVSQSLLKRLQKELGLGKRQVYRLIQEEVADTHLDRHLAAIVLGSESGIPTAKYATSEDLAAIRGSGTTLQKGAISPPPARSGAARTLQPIAIDLAFITDADLVKILRRDLRELNTAHQQGVGSMAKTCIVLAGSMAEALLLDAILKNKQAALSAAANLAHRPGPNPEDWGLYDLVTVAINMNPALLQADAEAGANQLRSWRNLIHPGRELKQARSNRIKPTPARAQNAIAFLQLIAEELRP